MNTCLITGCRLIIPAEGKSLWGDLHLVGPSYVFNGGADHTNDAAAKWDHDPEVAVFPEKQIILHEHATYFERRGVVVFDPRHSQPNGRARDYLQGKA